MSQFDPNQLCNFLDAGVTPFHVVEHSKQLLFASGFEELQDGENWQLTKPGSYFVSRNNSSIIAFKLNDLDDNSFHIIGAHTDSPCLKIKPNADIQKEYYQLGVEVYGGALLNPWFDRDLSIAGRVSGLTTSGKRFEDFIDFNRAIATIPSLAIHLDREANKNRSINAQQHLPLVLATSESLESEFSFKDLVIKQLHEQSHDSGKDDVDKPAEILDYELYCYDTQSATVTGLNQEFISSARLDNLLSTYLGLQALIDSTGQHNSIFISTDHEEVGSASACGAQGPFLGYVLEQISGGQFHQTIQNSRLISVDNAHALHPNFRDKHDAKHSPIMNQGPVIKINANQRYASNSITSADFRHLCQQHDIPVQSFVTRSDMGCGSTIGPITATELGIQTLDIGIPQLAMHSIREISGLQDCAHMQTALTAFLNR